MRLVTAISLGLLALASARPAWAASPPEPELEIPLVLNFGGGLSFPISSAASRIKMGGGAAFGIGYAITKRFVLQAEYFYGDHGLKPGLFSAQDVLGEHVLQYGGVNALFQVIPDRPFGLYVLGGPGVYYRQVRVTSATSDVTQPYCDPVLLICSTTPVPITEVLGARSTTGFGLNGGIGATLTLIGSVRLYLEARYHYTFGPAFNTPNGSRRADGQYVLTLLGFRY